jgi:HPt (histidine-containing phosphotransfer) domain-containing protein
MDGLEIDIENLSTLIGKDTSTLIRFLKIYESELNHSCIKIESAIQSLDYNTISITAHSLKSQSKYLNLKSIVALSQQIEQLADTKSEVQEIKNLLLQITQSEPIVYAAISRLITELESE